jgi:photosystem II stability/assembly factor-like uncharacterized protein
MKGITYVSFGLHGQRRVPMRRSPWLLAALLAGCASGDEYSWNEHTLGNDVSLRGISVLNSQVVWVTGSEGSIYKTESGGMAWEKVTIPDSGLRDFRDVEVLSEGVVLIMSAGEGRKSGIFRTADGGESWTQVSVDVHDEAFYDGFAFWNENEGILGGDPVEGEMFFLKTIDAGKTWQRIDPDFLPPLNKGESGGFAASGSHLAVQGNSVWISSVFAASRISFSNDKGATWNVVTTPIIQEASSAGIFSLAFFDKRTGVAVGGDYARETEGGDNVILTEDGGLTWQLAREFPVFQSAVRYLARDTLISVGPKAGYYSHDGGETWQRISGNGYHTVSVSRDGAVWAAGQGGRVARLSRRR